MINYKFTPKKNMHLSIFQNNTSFPVPVFHLPLPPSDPSNLYEFPHSNPFNPENIASFNSAFRFSSMLVLHFTNADQTIPQAVNQHQVRQVPNLKISGAITN